jgi:phage gp45-like
MISPEILTAIRREIVTQLNIILVATAQNATSDGTQEDIAGLYGSDQTIEARPKMQPFGFTSRAPAGLLSVVAQQGSGPSNRVVLGHRVPKGITGVSDAPAVNAEGDVVLYDAGGNTIYLGQQQGMTATIGEGKFVMQGGTFQIANSTAELLATLGDLVNALVAATVFTALGPQPFDAATITTLTEVLVKLESLTG